MKFSKAAMKTRHLKVAHLHQMGDNHLQKAPEPAPARKYSTAWYDPNATTNNGIAIPQQLRDQIEAAMKRTDTPQIAETKKAPIPEPLDTPPQKATFHAWGFF
jgi:hypothetical protein